VLNEEIEGPLTKIKKLRDAITDRAEMIGLALKYDESSWVNDMEKISGALLIEACKISEKQAIKIDNKRKARLPRSKKPLKTLTMKLMRKCRIDDHTLVEFIQSAVNRSNNDLVLEITTGSIENLALVKTAKSNQYTLTMNDGEAEYIEEDIKHATLVDWWTDCNK
jgi:hypothetical protein